MSIGLKKPIFQNWLDLLFALVILGSVVAAMMAGRADILLAGAIVLLALIAGFVAISLTKAKTTISRRHRPDPSSAAPNERIFFEIAADVIAQMRASIGTKAWELAASVQGLHIDKHTGRVLKMTKDPAEAIALLIHRYENFLGRRITTTPLPLEKDMAGALRPINKNLHIIEKYFNPNPR